MYYIEAAELHCPKTKQKRRHHQIEVKQNLDFSIPYI